MSFGEGNIRERMDELEDELSKAQGTVEDFACENVELRERIEQLEQLVLDFNEIAAAAYMLPGTVNYDTLLPLRERMAELGIKVGARES